MRDVLSMLDLSRRQKVFLALVRTSNITATSKEIGGTYVYIHNLFWKVFFRQGLIYKIKKEHRKVNFELTDKGKKVYLLLEELDKVLNDKKEEVLKNEIPKSN